MSGCYELKCLNHFGKYYCYYYFYSPRAIRSPKGALNSGCAPDAIRLLIADKEETPVEIRFVHNLFEYIYLKYFKNPLTFPFGYRVDWKKEITRVN